MNTRGRVGILTIRRVLDALGDSHVTLWRSRFGYFVFAYTDEARGVYVTRTCLAFRLNFWPMAAWLEEGRILIAEGEAAPDAAPVPSRFRIGAAPEGPKAPPVEG